MPINVIKGKRYTVDYGEMKSELMRMKIFHQMDIQKTYVDRWIDYLQKADTTTVSAYLNPNNQNLLLQEAKEAPEVFQTSTKICGNEFLLHFRVSRIREILQKQVSIESYIRAIDVEEFKNLRWINWTETEKTVEREDPIIIVPFTVGRTYKLLVVDGNHRITTAIRNNKKTVKAIILDPTALVANRLFCTRFDLAYYIFQNETVWMASHFVLKDIDEVQLSKESYLVGGNIHVAL